MELIKSKQRVLDYGEVFTPPHIVNEMIDMINQETDRVEARFLEPACGTGNFLEAILFRKLSAIQNYCRSNQSAFERNALLAISSIYGIDILADNINECRSRLFCNFDLVYTECFGNNAKPEFRENVRFIFERNIIHGDALVLMASEDSIIFQAGYFDVIIGNPPYQLSDGGFGKSATPIYNRFVQQAKKLNPRYLVMIIPSRWFGGGKGLDGFRKEMLEDDRIRKLVDFEDASDVFPDVNIAGGVCYFLWERDRRGLCEVTNVSKGQSVTAERKLDEFPTFIRHSRAVSIVRKVLQKNERRMSEQVTSRKPFGLRTFARPQTSGDLILRWRGGEGPYRREDITVGVEMIDKWKVITSKLSYDYALKPDSEGKRRVLSKIDILGPGVICTETYIVVGAFDDYGQAVGLCSYLHTRFVRFLISLVCFSIGITKKRFYFVPILDMSVCWNDKMLYERYQLEPGEIAFIESKICAINT